MIPGNDRSAWGSPATARPLRLDLGCGRQPVPGAIGVDAVALPGVRVVARLGEAHLPFRDGTVERMYALNVLEHLDDLPAAMAEIWRVLAPAGALDVEVPYFAGVSAHADPTHRRTFTYTTFEHFAGTPDHGWQSNRHTWFGGTRFAVTRRWLRFGRLHRLLGIEWLANRWPALYENVCVYWFPARALEVEMSKRAVS